MSENGDSSWTDYFVAGGTLRYNSPSYVKRPADDELLQAVMDGEFCYVLTPRQMGKSSLMVRTALRLRAEGVRTAKLDLTSIGTEVTAEQWYLGLVNRLARELRLRMDVQAWWEEHGSLGVVQRFSDFLRDQVLEQIDEQIVIFVDEIDATLNIPFSDDFFAAIRAFYNARADNPAFDRLSFVLLGVATPADLIKDRTRTPFNIGRRIDLTEFSLDDAGVLRDGMVACYPEQGQLIIDRVFHWTNGHPYLTQRLCLSAVEQDSIDDGEQWVDQEVDRLFLAEAARRETNLQFIRDYIGRFPPDHQRRLLDIYDQVHRGRPVTDDERSISQSQLKLVGLVKDNAGTLLVRNEIYSHVFDQEWIKETRPVDWNRRIAFIAVGAVILLAGALAYFFWNQNQVDTARVIQDAEEDFARGIPVLQLTALAGLFEWNAPETIDTALTLMDGIGHEERLAIFAGSGEVTNLEDDVRSAVIPLTLIVPSSQNGADESVLTTDASMPASTEDNELLAAMADALQRSGSEENERFARGINHWLAGRRAMEQGNWVRASIRLSDANSSLLRGNPAILYDIALVHIENGRYEEALAEMTDIMALEESRSDYSNSLLEKSLPFWQSGVEEIILTEQELYDALWQNPDQYPELIAMVPLPTSTPAPTLTPTPAPVATGLPAGVPLETATESSSPTATQTPIPTATPTADSAATLLAGCSEDLEVVDEHTYRNNTNLWAPANASFDLYWTLRNSGTCPWPADLSWKFIEGEDFGYSGDPIPLAIEISPGETIELATSRVFRAPAAGGYYRSTWQLVDADGNPFGPPYTFAVGITRPTVTPAPRPTSIAVPPTSPPSSGGGGSGSVDDGGSTPPQQNPPDIAPPTASP